MVVDAFRKVIADTGQSAFYAALRLVRGQIYSIVTPGSKYEVITPVATAGARGTEYLTLYSPTDTWQGNGKSDDNGKGNGRGKGHKNKPAGIAQVYVIKGVVYVISRTRQVDLRPGGYAIVDGRGVMWAKTKP